MHLSDAQCTQQAPDVRRRYRHQLRSRVARQQRTDPAHTSAAPTQNELGSGARSSKADKAADDVAALRALAEKQEAEKKKAEADDKARMAELRRKAEESAKKMGVKP